MEIKVCIDARDFRAFAFFDVFIRLKRVLPFVLFAGILTISAVLCFVLPARGNNALLGSTLLVVGLGLPLAYVKQFSSSVNAQIKKMNLGKEYHVYTLCLSPQGVTAVHALSQTEESYPWEEVVGIWRRKTATYLYVKSTKAFLIPDRAIPDARDLTKLLASKLPPEKQHGQR